MMTQEEFIGYFQLWWWNWDKLKNNDRFGYVNYPVVFKKIHSKLESLDCTKLTNNKEKNQQKLTYLVNDFIRRLISLQLYLPIKIQPVRRIIRGDDHYQCIYQKDDNGIDYYYKINCISYLCKVAPYDANTLIQNDIVVDFNIDDGVCECVSIEEDVCMYEITEFNDKLMEKLHQWLITAELLTTLLKGFL